MINISDDDDESVIFMGEVQGSSQTSSDFIPLTFVKDSDSKIRNVIKINIEDDDDDESVIFMGEVQGSSQTSSDFIPLTFVKDSDSKIRNVVKINIEDDDDDESVIFMGEVQGSSQTSSDFIPLTFVKDSDSKIRNVVKINTEDDNDDEPTIFMREVPGPSQTSSDFIPLTFVKDSDSKIRNVVKINTEDDNDDEPTIFMREVPGPSQTSSDFIPLSRSGEIEFTDSEKTQNEKYNSNIYNPNKDETIKISKKRMIIIDGSNVAFEHANCKNFSSRGLEIAINFFESKGHEVKAVVPKFRCNHYKSTDRNKLIELNRCGKIVFTPGKNLPDLKATSYDDRFTLQLALEFDAAIASNDNYRDLLTENPGFKKLIENRVITYTWCNDLFIVSKDPYGKIGPTLEQILNRNIDSE